MLSLYAKAGISPYWLGWNTQAKNGELSPALHFFIHAGFRPYVHEWYSLCWFLS
ncbi:hypothetical protein B4109_3099 [Geobacillus stearothermophilus]|uniref:Uncharacterized protein n=1 Tax=Geobacillus stearothermophilus TaxID=1422 RepID=A0A150MT52_GEOSE|nr:hypothetical protein B4109_3099 [Geobacillus stearothermophilus]